MFWSKIWFFLVAVVAGVTLTLALVMPRPAERATVVAETKRLAHACSITEILLRDFAQSRIQLAGETARVQGVDRVLLESSKGETVSAAVYSVAKKILGEDMSFGTKRKGGQAVPYRPDLILALDTRGRVVARSGKDEKLYGDSLAGYFLVDDALDGYLGDDLWILGGQLFLVAAAPVISTGELDAGAVVIGEAVDKEFATELADKLEVKLTFYAAGEAVATSDAAQLHEEVLARAPRLFKRAPGGDCVTQEAFAVTAGDTSYWALLARLPGEAGAQGAFYSVHIPQEKSIGFAGTIRAVTKNDLSFSHFPWLRVAIVFLLMVGVGLALMVFEADQPLRRLSGDVVLLAKGDSERLAEEKHRGKFGSIARSVNIALDKLQREARAARRDLDQLLGPVPPENERSTPTAAGTGPGSGLSAAFTPPPPPPPPSEFRFTDGMRAAGPISIQQPAVAPPSIGSPPAFVAPPAPPTDDRIPPPSVSLPPMGKRTAAGAAARAPTPRPPVPGGRAASPGGRGPEGSGAGPSFQDQLAASAITGRTQQISIEDDEEDTVVAGGRSPAGEPDDGQYRAIFDEFVALKRRCGESIDNLTYDRFLTKLRANRDALMAKHGCRSVKFQVYVKDGKAALKASPVR